MDHISHTSSHGSHDPWPVSSTSSSVNDVPRVQVLLPEQQHQGEGVGNTQGKKSYSIEIVAGVIVVAVALVVLVVALSIILPGIPQTIVVTMALSLLSLGGMSILKNLVYKAREALVSQDSEKLRVRHALGIGAVFAGLGLAMKVSALFIPRGYNLVVNKMGGSTYDKGGSSLLTTLSHYIYLKFYKSPKVDRGEPLTSDELRIEAKKLKRIAMGVVGLGIALLVLGVLIAVSGHIFVTGVASTVMLAVASPVIALSLSFILQTLLNSSIGQWRVFEEASKQNHLFVESKISDLRKKDVLAPETQIPQVRIDSQTATPRITSQEISQAIGFSHKQKITLAIATLLLLAGFAAVCVAGFVPLTGVYAYFLCSIGATFIGIVVPVVSSGVVSYALQLRSRYRIAKARWREKKEQAAVFKELKETFGDTISHNQALKVWELVGKNIIEQTEQDIRAEISDFKTGRQIHALLIGSGFIVCGAAIMLLALIPIFFPITTGIMGSGGIIFALGCAAYFRQLVIWLHALVEKLRKKREERRIFLEQVSTVVDVHVQDLVVEGLGDVDMGDIDNS